ncbi:MAG: cysteine--tRNA ligase, partial [Anaerolineae bacterium]|nr:cysteine--tRNA ligase [Anaerolineae bacterium]
EIDADFLARFAAEINDDLNMPRALAVVWDLVKSELAEGAKKATLLKFDEVLGLRLVEWEPEEVVIPAEILELAEQRQVARAERRWQDADALREKIKAAGYEIEDMPQGPRIKPA